MTKRTRIYIAGQITGEPNYRENFAEAERRIKDKLPDAIVFNPAAMSDGTDWEYEDYMAVCFPLVDRSDVVVVIGNWSTSPGANRETHRAIANTTEVIYIENFLMA